MEYTLYAIIAILFFTSVVLFVRLKNERREIRRFSRELKKHSDTGYAQPIKVDIFRDEITDLAIELNNLSGLLQTERIEYEKQRESLGNVISGISHDFRTPLTSALGYMQLIEKSGELSKQNADCLRIAIQKNNYLKELSDEFFELSKADNTDTELNLQELNLSNILSDALLEQHPWIEAGHIDTDFEIREGCIVYADETCLMRILQNLMSNAQKYTKNKFGVKLRMDKHIVQLCVFNTLHDTENVDLSKVFEPFYRMNSRTNAGSGLGLYVAKKMCDKLHWSIKAEVNDDVFSVLVIIEQ